MSKEEQPEKTIAELREEYLAAKDEELVEAMGDRSLFHKKLVHELVEGRGMAIVKSSERSQIHLFSSEDGRKAVAWWNSQGVVVRPVAFGVLLIIKDLEYAVNKTKVFDYELIKANPNEEEW